MLVLVDSYWKKAARRAEALGITEEQDADRYAEYVRAAYEEERRRGGLLLKGGLGQYLLKKSVGFTPKAKPHQVKKDSKSKGKPKVGSFAVGQRPDHKGPKQGRVVAVGKHGIQLKDDKGRIHKIRHEHVTSHQAPVEEKEWAKLAKVLADSGEKVDPVSRFSKPEKKAKADPKSRRSLKTLAKKHKNIDAKRALKEGSPEEVQALIEHYRNKPKPKKALKKSEGPRRECLACGRNILLWGDTGRLTIHGEGRNGVTTNCPGSGAHAEMPDRLPEDIRVMKGYINSDEHWEQEPCFDVCKHCGGSIGFGNAAKAIPWNHTENEHWDEHHTPEPEQDHYGTDGNQCVGCHKAVYTTPHPDEVPDRLPPDIQSMKSRRAGENGPSTSFADDRSRLSGQGMGRTVVAARGGKHSVLPSSFFRIKATVPSFDGRCGACGRKEPEHTGVAHEFVKSVRSQNVYG